jgi:hypothetical protein
MAQQAKMLCSEDSSWGNGTSAAEDGSSNKDNLRMRAVPKTRTALATYAPMK